MFCRTFRPLSSLIELHIRGITPCRSMNRDILRLNSELDALSALVMSSTAAVQMSFVSIG